MLVAPVQACTFFSHVCILTCIHTHTHTHKHMHTYISSDDIGGSDSVTVEVAGEVLKVCLRE